MDRSRAGFSLIEVNMAILIIAVGMLSLMSLFPLGLRESTLAQGDMHQAAGADYMLSRIQAEASRITRLSPPPAGQTWQDFRSIITTRTGFLLADIGTLNNFPGEGDRTRYRLRIRPIADKPLIYGVSVQLTERERGDFENNTWFYTEVIFHGTP